LFSLIGTHRPQLTAVSALVDTMQASFYIITQPAWHFQLTDLPYWRNPTLTTSNRFHTFHAYEGILQRQVSPIANNWAPFTNSPTKYEHDLH